MMEITSAEVVVNEQKTEDLTVEVPPLRGGIVSTAKTVPSPSRLQRAVDCDFRRGANHLGISANTPSVDDRCACPTGNYQLKKEQLTLSTERKRSYHYQQINTTQ